MTKKFSKIESIEYLIEHSVYTDEWSGAGMYVEIERIIQLPKLFYFEKDLKKILRQATNF